MKPITHIPETYFWLREKSQSQSHKTIKAALLWLSSEVDVLQCIESLDDISGVIVIKMKHDDKKMTLTMWENAYTNNLMVDKSKKNNVYCGFEVKDLIAATKSFCR